MSLIREIYDVIMAQRQDGQRLRRACDPQHAAVIMTPETYRRLLREAWSPQERGLVTREAPDQALRIAAVPVVVGEVPEAWGWMLQVGGRRSHGAPPDAGEGGER